MRRRDPVALAARTSEVGSSDAVTEKSLGAVLTVASGRGFVVNSRNQERAIVTAAHCLPAIPPAMSFSLPIERTYFELIGPLGSKPAIAAECLFVDPVSDLALLAAADNQECPDDAEAFEALVAGMSVLTIGTHTGTGPGAVISPDNQFRDCEVRRERGVLWTEGCKIQGGMSGSPILSIRGEAIGVVVTNNGPHAYLDDSLPAWLWRSHAGVNE